MTLPRPILHRIRRAIRRQLMNATDRETLRIIEEWTGHRRARSANPLKRMKIPRIILLLFLLVAAWLAASFLTGCATVETKTTVTAPDGTVTVTESKSTAPDAGSVGALSTTAQAFAPRAVIVNSGK